MKVINPATNESIKELSTPSAAVIQAAYQAAVSAQTSWAKQPISERLEVIRSFHQLLEVHLEQLAETLTLEVGKPLAQAKGEIRGARGRIQYFLEHAEKWLADEWITETGPTREKISYEPLGVIGNISAWNYPYLVGVNVFIPALLAGNAVLYKPSEFASLTGLAIGRLLHKAGVPESVFVTLIGGRKTGESLLELPLDGYYFTGSYRTGKYIYERVATKMVPCQLELGGKDPLYVSSDNAHPETVAVAAAEGAFYNNGQSCCAVERIYVHIDVYDAFLAAFLQEVNTLKTGDPTEAETFIGPLTRREQIAVLEAQVKDAVEQGATLQTGGKAIQGPGYFFEPTVLTDVHHEMLIMKEESFGPIIGIQRVRSDEEAISLMKDTEYGLTASVYADSANRAAPILEAMNTGTVYWNCCDRVSATVPWSGRKQSGIGATLSYQGIRAFTQAKAYHLRGEWDQ